MSKISNPVIYEIDYSYEAVESLEGGILQEEGSNAKYLLDYPTVYIVHDEKKNREFSVYIGETSDIRQRTKQHLIEDPKKREDWESLANSDDSKMYIIGHDYFNKSLTLDIENKLMMYMSSIDSVQSVYNRRTNQQKEYYTVDKLDEIFSKIWRKLRNKNKTLFPVEKIIKDSALFKASPFHKLSDEQIQAKDKVILKIMEALTRNQSGELILVAGEAGSGKTVLMSSLFYELKQLAQEESENIVLQEANSYLLVNHEQQLKVYQQIANKLGITSKKVPNLVSKPTTFINNHTPEEKADVVIVDEAHLLWTQGKQSYRGKNQLYDLMERAKVVVAVFDINQVLTTEQYWEEEELLTLEHEANLKGNFIRLENQMRINASQSTINWIRSMIDDRKINPILKDIKGYDLKIFNHPEELYQAIRKKAKDENSGISRIIATFDWEYVDKRKPEKDDYWRVKIGNWSLPWNLQLPQMKEQKRKNRNLSWAEQEQTIDEVGSTFTIQGFDLNYAGVIIGPSVKYRNGEIVFDRSFSQNKKATRQRTLKNGKKEQFSDMLLKNELNVLLTRGVNGLYIYAVDEELQKALLNAAKG
ncbi:DUF2075 domain-containing protein [Carnobacterium inhibens]|uniref:ATP-dependent exonuclease n=2 Tax=Carnobacterium inhibens TaxID=147709 RepID=U5SC97_9LACT|nr:DUF2075 domain-containing protein [Carnobacterium inhibens]AGY81472.1 ATP-dependent exonuclease [Carnobacterium inhibens subsp. gilichinskyi]MBC9825016.1 DUF2075 domain-containing protein [Carnobacterium inhibens]MCM3512778.1 DUF2075 domain-containing protein [Carnobacterium inhibens]